MELNLEPSLFEELQQEEMPLIDGGVDWDAVGAGIAATGGASIGGKIGMTVSGGNPVGGAVGVLAGGIIGVVIYTFWD